MATHDVLVLVFLVLGYIFTGALYLSPIPTVWRICTAGNVGEYKADMFIATLASCLVWLEYGLPPPFSKAIVIINAVGIVLEAIYIGIYLYLSTAQNRRRVFIVIISVIVVLGCISSCVFPLVKHPRVAFGFIGDFSSVAMYAGPVRQMIAVWRTKDVQHMSVWVAAASLFNGISWTVYACLIRDWFILVPNTIGIVCGLVQLIFYMVIKYFFQPAGEVAEEGAAA